MSKQQQGYEAFIERLKAEWQAAEPGESLNRLIERTQAYLIAAETLTKDELALIAEYVKEDLREFEEAPGGYKDSAFYNALQESIWGWLLELTDRTQLEWRAVLEEVRHKGLYRVGDRMALGVLVCNQCGHRHLVLHPERIVSCIECGGEEFSREALTP